MMALVVPNVGEVSLLQKMLNQNQTANLLLGLYQSNTTPTAFTTLGDLTPPATTYGYSMITVTNASWLIATPVGADYAEAGYSEQTFTFTSNSTATLLYGYYVTDSNNNLLWLERFTNAPFTIPPAGGTVAITLTINLENV
jgi:hypothetical protein